MRYAVALSESVFPAQADGVVRDLSLGDQLRETAEQFPDKTGLVEVDIDGNIGRSWTYKALLAESEALALKLAGRF
jgi:non-ribosomal peptide synthetase component E (peptide arylation enzyme)